MKVSIVIPVYKMENGISLLKRNLDSIRKQNFRDYEIVISDDSEDNKIQNFLENYTVNYFRNKNHGMARNTNNAIDHAKGELIKILFQDDFFFDEFSLEDMVKHLTPTYDWLATGCLHSEDGSILFNPHAPFYSHSENTLGSPSVILFRNKVKERFNPLFSWVIDLEWYRRVFEKHGKPKLLNHHNVVIGIHPGQMTNKLSEKEKLKEQLML